MAKNEQSASAQAPAAVSTQPPANINPLLRSIRPSTFPLYAPRPSAPADEIAFAISNVFSNELSPVQTALLLYTLSLTGLEQHPDVLARCATTMRAAALPMDTDVLRAAIDSKRSERRHGGYNGGLCDIVGTGGDFHSTFNISTASSIICSSLLLIAKHGNRASTSKSGSADVLACMKLPHPSSGSSSTSNHNGDEAATTIPPNLPAVTPSLLPQIYSKTNYAFLFAPNFHTGLSHISALRKELPCPSIFNLLGPLTNPAEGTNDIPAVALEARVIGVKRRDLVDVFAEALRLMGCRKGMVVCGMEDLDEVSCAGGTECARLVARKSATAPGETYSHAEIAADPSRARQRRPGAAYDPISIEKFTITPYDFGLPSHPLENVGPGKGPEENAETLRRILRGEIGEDDPVLHFVLMNAATLFVVSGVCEGQDCAFGSGQQVVRETGPGGGRWKEGVRLARLAISSGRAWEMLRGFAEVTNGLR